MNINEIAFEITKLYMGKKLLNSMTVEEYTKEFFETYNKVCVFLKSHKISFDN